MKLSYYTLSMFEKCPAKFHYYTQKLAKPLPPFEVPAIEWGKKFHLILQHYYQQLLNQDTFDTSEILTNIHIAVSKTRSEIEDLTEFHHALQQFEAFEYDRLQWCHFKPIAIEKNFNNSQFTGRIDILFKDNQNNLILVDWKKAKFHNSYLIQAYVYKLLANPHLILFFFSQSGFTVTITPDQLKQGEQKVNQLLQQISSGLNERRFSEDCKTCEFSIACLTPKAYKNYMVERS